MTILIILAIYLAPTIIALIRHKRNFMALLVFNALLGWTVLGWIGALVWACLRDPEPA